MASPEALTLDTGSQMERNAQDVSVNDRVDRVLSDTSVPINTEMNKFVSHKLQMGDAEKVVSSLQASRDLARLAAELEAYQNGTSTDELSEDAKKAILEGETPESLIKAAEDFQHLSESTAIDIESPVTFDVQLKSAREAYIKALVKKRGFRRGSKKEDELQELESEYNNSLLNKMAELMQMDPNHRKAAYVPEVMKRMQEQNPTLESLEGNQLHMLVDLLSREQLLKAELIEANTNLGSKRVLNAFKRNRALRVVIGGAIWAGSLAASHKGLLPSNAEFIGEGFKHILPLVAGYLTSKEVMTGVDEGLQNFKQNRKNKKDIESITASPEVSDSVLRTIYNSTEYEAADRHASKTKEENASKILEINDEFADLQNEGSRGGKPYKAEVILPYVADLYLNRKEQIDSIINSEDPKEAFLSLCKAVVEEDTRNLTEKQQSSRAKKALIRVLSVGSSVFVGQWMNQIQAVQQASVRPIKIASSV